jgi:hypothetical protein
MYRYPPVGAMPTCNTTCSDFSDTATIFLNTALQVQNLLAEITPTQVPDPTLSIPGIFNEWLENLIDTYPSGCQLIASHHRHILS